MLGHISGGNPARQLSSKPEIVKRLALYREKVKALLTLGLRFEACTKIDVTDKALELQKRYGLLTNDSVILAVAVRLKADVLVSAAAYFEDPGKIARWD